MYAQMLQNLERTGAAVRSSISKASTISDEECQLALTEDDFLAIQWKIDKIDQKLADLYGCWQAEYKNAVTSGDCKEVKRLYKPYIEKYESKYRILYQMLQQSNRPMGQAGIPSVQEPTFETTPSLAALDDAQVLRRKEWKRGEPSEDIPRQYSTVCRHLTPTQPRHEDMRMDSTLDVTPEGSLSDLSAAMGGAVGSRREQRAQEASEIEMRGTCPSTTIITLTDEIPYTSVKTVPGRDSNEQRSNQVELPRQISRTREASLEDALAFALAYGQNQAVTSEIPEEVPAVATEEATAIPPTIPTTSATTTVTGTETGIPRMFLPNGSPSRPTATATCRPQTWVQCVSEGWTNSPPPDGTGSRKSSLSGPSLLEEEVPENLGHEWRILHPFEIPGVRFPTDNTPPNQRRLAENDALVELIQTTEYLEVTPMWGQRDYRFYPPGMVTLYIEEEEEAEEEVEE